MTAVGDIASYMARNATTEQEQQSWSDGGSNKVILHGLVGAAIAALGGGNAAGGGLGAGASEAASSAMQQYLVDNGYTPGTPAFNAMMQLGSAAVGAAGGGSGSSTALAGDTYNRQLHPDYVRHLQSEATAYAAQQCACDLSGLSSDEYASAIDSATKETLINARSPRLHPLPRS